MKNKLAKISLFLITIASVFCTSIPVKAAEQIILTYGSIKLSLRVESLEDFAENGTINEDLAKYLDRATPEQQKEFKKFLTEKFELDPVLVSRFFNTEMGEQILLRLGKGITIEGGVNGGIALRSAIVQAAFEPSGLTLINILKKYPTNLQIEGKLVKEAADKLEGIVSATEILVKNMRTWTMEEASVNSSVNFAQLPDIRSKGEYEIKKEVWQLYDETRDRKFYTDVYIPQKVTGNISVIVFSHGLSSRPEDYSDTLNHLASYGFLVIAPQHVGSDIIYLKEMFEGYHKNIFDVQEFINRPKDISFVLDELERRNQKDFQGQLNLKNVGMGGHSFGGYTTLAIAGATIDFNYLQEACESFGGALNVSLLLECRALELPREDYQFRDTRVQAIFAGNPVNRYIFGEKGISKIDIPVILGSGSDDPAAPAAIEQAIPFTWLVVSYKYWMLIEGQAHVNFSKLDGGIKKALDSTIHLTLPSQDLISSYVNGVSLAFFQFHINKNEDYLPYLNSSYAEYLSQNEKFKLNLITGNSSEKLQQAIEDFRNRNR